MEETVMSECDHGIPLVNGKGCMICSNRSPKNKVFIRLERGKRETQALNKLRKIATDMVDEVPTSMFL